LGPGRLFQAVLLAGGFLGHGLRVLGGGLQGVGGVDEVFGFLSFQGTLGHLAFVGFGGGRLDGRQTGVKWVTSGGRGGRRGLSGILNCCSCGGRNGVGARGFVCHSFKEILEFSK